MSMSVSASSVPGSVWLAGKWAFESGCAVCGLWHGGEKTTLNIIEVDEGGREQVSIRLFQIYAFAFPETREVSSAETRETRDTATAAECTKPDNKCKPTERA